MLKKSQIEFTLIELVIVIIVLGILEASALPKFVDISTDAKIATLESVAGAMKSGLTLVRSAAGIQGKHTGNQTIIYSGTEIPLYNGYPSVDGGSSFIEINQQVKAWLEIDAVDRNTRRNEYLRGDDASTTFFTDKSSPQNQIYIFFGHDYYRKGVDLKCQVLYTNAEGENPVGPVINVQTEDC